MTARDVIAQALALSEAASKGPWHEEAGNVHDSYGGRLATGGATYDSAVPNATFIAAARTLLPAFAKALGDVLAACDAAEEEGHYSAWGPIRAAITAALSEVGTNE